MTWSWIMYQGQMEGEEIQKRLFRTMEVWNWGEVIILEIIRTICEISVAVWSLLNFTWVSMLIFLQKESGCTPQFWELTKGQGSDLICHFLQLILAKARMRSAESLNKDLGINKL